MTIRPIRIVGDPVLRRRADPVPLDGRHRIADLAFLIADMFDTLHASGGAGLSANQIGVPLRIFVYDCPNHKDDNERRTGVVLNPMLESTTAHDYAPGDEEMAEGCLSVPGMMFPLDRRSRARVQGFDGDGLPITLEGEGLFARMLQHEVAHLDGILYLDQLTEPIATRARRALSEKGLGCPGASWTPGKDPHPFRSAS